MSLESKTNEEKTKLHSRKFVEGLVIAGIIGTSVSQLLSPEYNLMVSSNIFTSLVLGGAYFPFVDKYIYQVKGNWKDIYEYAPARTVGLLAGLEGVRLFI